MGAVNNCTVDISKCVFTVGKHIIQVVVRDERSWRGFSLVQISDDKSDKDLHCNRLMLLNMADLDCLVYGCGSGVSL